MVPYLVSSSQLPASTPQKWPPEWTHPAQVGKEYLEIVGDAYPNPVSYRGENHFRCGSTKQELKGAALDKFLLRKYGRHWDGVPFPNVKVNQLYPFSPPVLH